MKILLINVPSRKGAGGFMVPLGLLYVGSIIERCGHEAKIIDPYLDDREFKDFSRDYSGRIDKIIEDYKPAVIGYGGIATSYGRAKELSLHVRENFPEIKQMAGGALASTYELLLTRTGIDVVFHGESEVSLPIFLERLEKRQPINNIPGTSCSSGNKVVRNEPAEQISNLDTIPFPAYHLVDISRYLQPVKDYLVHYKSLLSSDPAFSGLTKTIGSKTHHISIVTSRGCTHRCSFCYRHVRGIRRHSVDYAIKHIRYLKETYGISGFQFCDELFNSSNEWVLELCDALEKNNLDIYYLVGGARADKIDEQMLRRLKETGCIEVDYGQESGSDEVLREYRKGVTSQRNREVTRLTKAVGLLNVVQIVIGSPGETNSTIRETIQFLKDVNAFQFSLNYLIALPETPIWKYVQESNLIPDVEEYLDKVAEFGGSPLVNLTKQPDRVWRSWHRLITAELKLHFYKQTRSKFYYYLRKLEYYLLRKPEYYLIDEIARLVPQRIKILIPGWLKRRL